MQTVSSSEFKRGLALMLEGAPQIIDDFYTTGTAQTRHKLHVKPRNLKTGRITERVFADNERVPVAELQTRTVQFSYQQGDTYTFMDTSNYEEMEMPAELVGERKYFLKENEECKAQILEGRLLDIVLPLTQSLKIKETAPSQKGGSVASWKPAILETGLEIMVPLFIGAGESVRVDTASRKYLGKDNE